MLLNKKLRIVSVAFLISMLAISSVNAIPSTNRPYLGMDLQYNHYTFYGVGGTSIFGGYIWDDVGLELGYTELGRETWNDTYHLDSSNVYLDGTWLFPLDDEFSLKAIGGVGVFHSKLSGGSYRYGTRYMVHGSETSVGARFGVGIQYKINNDFTTCFSYKFQTNANTIIGYISIYSLGISYYPSF